MKITILSFSILASVMLFGCEKFITLDPPENELVTATVFNSNETATSAMNGLYGSMMRSNLALPYNISLYTGLYADELDYKLSSPLPITIYKNILNSKDAPTNLIWESGYNFIYQANSIIEGLNESTKISKAVKKQLLGEAIFIRNFWYFYLCCLYGDIPWTTTTDYVENAKMSRTPAVVVLHNIAEDLIIAKQLLTDKYVGSNSLDETIERIRPNRSTVSSLLAKVHLLQKDWKKADEEASTIIDNPKYRLESITNVFKRNSQEAIWQLELPPSTSYYNTYEALFYLINRVPSGTSTFRISTLSANLLSLFEAKDLRRTSWVGVFKDESMIPNMTYFFPGKYKSIGSAIVDEYTSCFRLADIYLIRAEARANLSLINLAISDIDFVRIRAGLSMLSDIRPGIQKNELLDSVSAERQRELFCEWGNRWIDIKRATNMEEIMTLTAAKKSTLWKNNKVNWPIPLSEIINNRNLKQNDGYN